VFVEYLPAMVGRWGTWDGFLRKTVFTFHIGKTLEVENVRLGVCAALLHFLALVAVICYGVGTGFWWSAVEPVGFGLDIWRPRGPDVVAAAKKDVLHCRDPQSYWHQSSDQLYRPASCRKLPPEEAHNAGDRSQLLFPTNVRDTSTWHGEGQDCDVARHWCAGRAADYYTTGTKCSCTWTDEFLVMNPEEEHVAFHHGFEANLGGSQRPRVVVRAGTGLESVWEGPLGEMKRQPGRGLLTVILNADRSRCKVGGQAAWSAVEAAGGISGSIKEWLACAGVTLDTDPQSLVPSQAKVPKHLRTLGLAMQLVLEYTNDHSEPDHDGVVCFVTVRVEPLSAAAALERKDIVQFPMPSQNQTAWRTRAARVVAVSLKAGGSYRYVNFSAAPQVLINMLVLLQLPALVLSFIVLHCLGQQSQVYRNARKSRFDPFQQFVDAISRSMVAEAGFRGMLGGAWKDGMAELEGLSPQHLFQHLRGICGDELTSGAMHEAKLQQVALAAVHQLGDAKTGTVSCAQFARACMASGSVSLQDVATVVSEYQRFAHEKIQDVQLDDPEKAPANNASQRREWEADVEQRLKLLEQCFVMSQAPNKSHAAESNCSAMGFLGLLQSRLQDKVGSGNGDPVAIFQKEAALQKEDSQTSASSTKDGTSDASLPFGVLKKLDQQVTELRQECERRIKTLEHHLRMSPVQEGHVKSTPILGRSCPRLPLDGIGNAKSLEESLKATFAGPAGAVSACSTARGTVSTVHCDAQSRLYSQGSASDSDVQSSSMTVRGQSLCESSAVVAELELTEMLETQEKAESCQGMLTSQGLDHVQVWYPFERTGDEPKAPEAPVAVALKESSRRLPSALPPLSLSADVQASHTVRAVPVPPPQPSFYDPGQTSGPLVGAIPETKQKTHREPQRETPKGSPKESPRESDLLRRRPDFGKVELGVECKRYMPVQGKQQRAPSRPPAEAAKRGSTEGPGGGPPAITSATMRGTGTMRA